MPTAKSELLVGVQLPTPPVDSSEIMPLIYRPTLRVNGSKDESQKATFRPDSRLKLSIAWWVGETDWWITDRYAHMSASDTATWERWWKHADKAIANELDEIEEGYLFGDVLGSLLDGDTAIRIDEGNALMRLPMRTQKPTPPDPSGFTATLTETWGGQFGVTFEPEDDSHDEPREWAYYPARKTVAAGWYDLDMGVAVRETWHPELVAYADAERARYQAAVRLANKWSAAWLLAVVGLTASGATVERR